MHAARAVQCDSIQRSSILIGLAQYIEKHSKSISNLYAIIAVSRWTRDRALDIICHHMRGISDISDIGRVAKTLTPALLAMVLVAHVDWCFCAPTCCAWGNAPATVASDAPASGCGCCQETPAQPCCGRSAPDKDDSSCSCCVESPLSRPPDDGDNGSRQIAPLHSGIADNAVTLARALPVAVRPSVRTLARYGLPLYLQFEVLRI